VTHGSARVRAGDEEHLLAAGDTLYLAAGVPHSWHALTDDARVLLVAVNEKARVNLEPPTRETP
jgi:quercetin dioxygenase-like cupin family protein